MTTGDLKNNLRKLVSELKQVHFPQNELDLKGIAQGIPKAFLPALHHVFLDYSISLAQYFSSKEYELYGKTDLRFLETVYKVLRDEFGYKPHVTKEQFLTIGFAERKIISLCDILKLLRGKHEEMNPKSSKSDKKKGKSTQLISGENTAKEISSRKSTTASSDYFPGPLPVNTDMKSFQSNKQAMEAGFGLKEPLVTRMIADEDLNFEGTVNHSSERGSACSDKDSDQLRKSTNSTDNSVPSNLIIKTTHDERRFGVKFPVSRNAEIRSNLSRQPAVNILNRGEPNLPGESQVKAVTWEESNLLRQPQVKTVTWEDEVKDSQVGQTVASEDSLPLSNEPVAPVSVPARIHSIPFSGTLPAYYPTEMGSLTAAMRGMLHAIPHPVSMTTAPIPSPDLMLTPVVKGIQREAIPLSGSQKESDLHNVPFASANHPCTRVVRHSKSLDTVTGELGVAPLGAHTGAEVFVLRQQVQELQEKYDSMVLLNNEMSARVVLLESRMKLLEEACEKKYSCDYKTLSHTNTKDISRQDDHVVVSGFNACSDKDLVQQFSTDTSANGTNTESVVKHNSTSRKLFKETATLAASGDQQVKEPTPIIIDLTSEKYDNEADGDDSENFEHAADKGKCDHDSSFSDKDDSLIFSPLPSASKLSGVFTDSSTKNTVVNVHKRLQETRELLARTNRDFAAKFNRYQIE